MTIHSIINNIYEGTAMNLNKRAVKDKTHIITSTTKGGKSTDYYYKLFRVKRADGRPTTVSFDLLDYIQLQQTFRPLSQADVSLTVRAATRMILANGPLPRGRFLSREVYAKVCRILEARKLGVSLDEYEHAAANNAEWSAGAAD